MYPPQTRLRSCRIRVTLAGEIPASYLPSRPEAEAPCPRNRCPSGLWAAECVWETSRIIWAFHSGGPDPAAVPPPCKGTKYFT